MRFSQIEAQHCGAVTGLRIEGLQPGLNVILGPNGCGKTSLLRFVRELLADTGSTTGRVSSALPAAGALELECRSGPVRVVRIPRPGHPDTVAVIAMTLTVANQVRGGSKRRSDEAADLLLRYVEASHLHQAPALAQFAREVTERLCAAELGTSWPLVCAAARIDGDLSVPVMAVLSRLPAPPDDPAAADSGAGCDLATIDSNWRTVIAALERQREQLSLESETRVRVQLRQQREWATRLRWLNECAQEQSVEIERLDADWQAAGSDLATRMIAPVAEMPSTPSEVVERRLLLLGQVIEDLAADRLQIALQLAHSPVDTQAALADERRRIEGCEQQVIAQMQRLLIGRHAASGVCASCGAPQAAERGLRDDAAADERSRRYAELRHKLFDARQRLAATSCQVARLQALIQRCGLDPAIDRMRYDGQILGELVVELRARREAELTATAIVMQFASVRRHDILRQAAAYLSELTAGRYTGLRWNSSRTELLADDSSGEHLPVGVLSRGASEQVAMALRLAVLRGLARLGETGPILWDEPLADSDERRLAAAAELLARFAADDSQLLLFTCREHVARALEAHGARVHAIGADTAAVPLRAVSDVANPDIGRPLPEVAPRPSATAVRVHPSSTFWLHPEAPLELVPSLGPQFARRLRSLGIAEIRDLLDFNLTAGAEPLTQLQVTASQMKIWQAEARLLTEVPGLTGRDAQMLVSSGLLSRVELANADVEELTRRIDRLRGGDTLRWRMGPSTAPHRETIERWIDSARLQPPADPAARNDTTPRRRPEQPSRRGRVGRPPVPTSPPAVASRFRLQPDSPIVDAPSIGHKTARRLERIGIVTVRDLLACDPHQTAPRMRHRRITPETVLVWQQQAGLMCSVPDLRCADAIVLVACGITGPLDLRRISPAALQAMIGPFATGATGHRLLRGATPPTADDVARWIETVEESRIRRAA